MSTGLHGVELDYRVVHKEAFPMFKVVKQFRPYILKNHTKVIIPQPVVRSLYMQKELGEGGGIWVTAMQEYDLEFNPTTIIKGKDL
jgi:hypothetical protein